MLLLGLDLGTTGCKAIVFDADGRLRARAFREYGVVYNAPAKAEQDAEHVWTFAKEALREVAAQAGEPPIRALSVSVQGDAIIPVDREFTALHPAILGMDYRSAAQARRCEELFGGFELFQRTGMRPHPMNSLTKVLFLRERAPAVFSRAWKIVTYADFILGKLGAEAVIDHTMASRTMAFDLGAKAWDRGIHAGLDLDPGLWSSPVPSGTVVGTLRPALATELGLPRDLALVTGGHDQTCAALGAGVVRAGVGVVSTGTAEVLSTALNSPALTRAVFDGFYPCYCHAKSGLCFTFALNHTAGILLRWWRDHFAAVEVADATARGLDPYQVIDERMPEEPSPVTVVPHWNGSGTPTCDLEAKGAIVGLTLATTRHDIAKAILEGLCFELRTNLDTLQAAGVPVAELVAVGGGARSPRWLQLKADILGRPVRTLISPDAACLGAALLAGTATGAYPSLDDAVRRTVAFGREFAPQPAAVARYAERYATYRHLYPALRSLNPSL
jgi:xylulokinase